MECFVQIFAEDRFRFLKLVLNRTLKQIHYDSEGRKSPSSNSGHIIVYLGCLHSTLEVICKDVNAINADDHVMLIEVS